MRFFRHIFIIIIILTGVSIESKAQFKEAAFQQNYNESSDSTAVKDSVDKLFSFKDWYGGLTHKHTIKVGTMFAGSVILPGTAQIYNKDYWKLPIIYGGIGALAGTGGHYLSKYKKTQKAYDQYIVDKTAYETNTPGGQYPHPAPEIDLKSKKTGTWLMAGAGLVYWGSLMDGVVSYLPDHDPLPGKATLYSILLPGLGQIYNGELYKAPIYWGCLIGSYHFLTTNNTNYKRFKRIYSEANTDPSVPIDSETAKWYRDVYRRYRDYSIVATALFYLLQVIDANVFAYMHDFEVTDEISMGIEPAVIAPDNAYAINHSSGFDMSQSGVGARIRLRF